MDLEDRFRRHLMFLSGVDCAASKHRGQYVRVVVVAYRLLMKSIMAALTCGARSCWVQWPQPGSIIAGRSLGTSADCFAISWEKTAATKSRSPSCDRYCATRREPLETRCA